MYRSAVPDDAPGGSYFPVTVLADVTEDMAVATDETFGPVVAISRFDGSEAEAARLANGTESLWWSVEKSKAERELAKKVSHVIRGVREAQVALIPVCTDAGLSKLS